MSTFVKKATSAVAGLAVVFSIVSPIAGVSAAYTSLDAANKLATLGIVVDNSSNPADYRLGDFLPRKEAVKVMMNLSSIAVVDNCNGDFSDLTSADWACKYAETALANGMVAANATFGPDRLLSNIEGLKMVFQGRDLDRNENADWRAGYVDAAVEMGIADAFTNYDSSVTRGQFFIWAANAIDEMTVEPTDPDDLLCEILGTCDDTTDPTDPVDPTDPTDPVVVVDGDLEVSLSPATPDAATIPGGVNGLAAAAFDFTAGDSDVTVTQVSVKRTGLSDESTIDKMAIFSSEGRVSNAKSDNQDNDTTAQINLDNGGIVVKAGETKTLVVVVDIPTIASTPGVESDEFALELVDVVANGNVEGLGARGNTMRIGSVDAPTLTFTNGGSVSNPNLGEEAADIFEFEIDGDNNENVILEAITFEGSSDAEDDLENFELLQGNKVVATTAKMSGDYLTFELDGLVIEEDKNEDFTVRADVIDGASDTISFDIDAKLDVTANSTKFGFGAAVVISGFNPPAITIQAGELTFVEVNSDIDEIREDKDNVALGRFNIINLSGNQLELENFATVVGVTTSGATPFVDVNNNGINDAGDLAMLPGNLFDEVELYNEDTGSSYTLTNQSGALATVSFADDNIDAIIPTGTSKWIVRADTAEHIVNFDNVKISTSVDVNGGVKVVELTDDEEVTDKTPSNLSFDTIDGSESGAKVNLIPLSNTNVVRGAKEVTALTFEVEAEEVSSLVVDELAVIVRTTAPTVGLATKQQISQVTLYKDSISSANELDSDTISNAGGVSFDDMGDITIAANGRQTFVVALEIVDGVDPVGVSFVTELSAISIEDDESDDITISPLPVQSGRTVAVQNSGTIATLSLDAANEDNKFDKLALAGDSTVIASWDVRGNNESIDVETVTVTLGSVTGILKNSITSANLLLDGVVVGTASNSDVSNVGPVGTILFDDLTALIIPESTSELAVQLNTASIGKDKVGAVQTALTVTDIALSDAEGDESGKPAAPVNTATTSKTLDIVSAVVTPAVVSTFGTDDQTAELRLVVDGGSNTTTGPTGGDAVQAELASLKFDVSSITSAGNVTIFNSNGTQIGTTAVAAPAAMVPAVAATSTITVGGTVLGALEDPASANITVSGVTIAVDIAAGADNNAIATAIAAAIDAHGSFSAVAATNVVTITHGTTGTSVNGNNVITTALVTAIDTANVADNDTTLVATNFAGGVDAVPAVTSTQVVIVTIDSDAGTIGNQVDSISNDNEIYRIENTAEAVVRLAKDGVTYSTNNVGSTTTKLENTLEIGQYADSN